MQRKLVSLIVALLLVLTLAPTLSLAEELPYVELDWYIGYSGGELPGRADAEAALNEYLMEKINCKVNLKFLTTSDWGETMGTMIASGQDMGILGFGTESKSDYIIESQRGAFYPMDELLEEYGQGTKALFPQEIWDAMKINGHIYGIPSLKDNGYFMSLIYNAEMAEAYGIDVDSYKYDSWRDFEDLFRLVKEKRDEINPEWSDRPVSWRVNYLTPHYFALETFLNDNYITVCNIGEFMDVAGYDPDTVFNLYETPEFLEFAKQKQRMVEENLYAYDYTNYDDWFDDGSIFAFQGWGYTYMPEHLYSDEFTTKMRMSDRIWSDTGAYFSSGSAISANCKNPERAMMVLELANTDPFVATTLRFGAEGLHYTYDEEGNMTFAGTLNEDPANRAYYYWYLAPVGNLTIVNAPEALTGPDGIMLEKMVEYNETAVTANHIGFVFDTTPVINEVAACSNVISEYQPELIRGQMTSEEEVEEMVEEMIEKLKANGSDKVLEEAQRQLDEWLANR